MSVKIRPRTLFRLPNERTILFFLLENGYSTLEIHMKKPDDLMVVGLVDDAF